MKKREKRLLIAFILFAISLIFKFDNVWINKLIFVLSYLLVGFKVIKKAVKNSLRGNVLDENYLMTIATIGAFLIGEFPEAVAVMLFYEVGELFQSYAVDKSRKSIASLMDIRPNFANVIRNEEITKIDPDGVEIGEIIVVKPGERIPLDGRVIEGESMIDTSALTGESIPKKVKVDNDVLSGCINQNGLLKISVTKKFGESTVSRILDLVENASSRKSKSENFITRFAKYYTPIIVIVAIALAIIPYLLFKQDLIEWIYRALSFLVISCPCALVISIPLSFFGGIGGASKEGILIKGSNYLEALSNTEIVVMDKTGTLTHGIFEVQRVEACNISNEELIRIVAIAESFSNHPIALSVKRAYNNDIDEDLVTETKELLGLGIYAKVENREVFVGNEKLMKNNNIEYIKCEEVGTILYVAIDNQYAGYILISDMIKEDSKQAIQELRNNNIKKIVMLTGDKKKVGESVASVLELDEVHTELLPDEKVSKAEELMKQKSPKGKLAFVGDGINDAPVLAISDIGIAMGGLGSDSAIEAADIVIMNDEPSKIAKAIKISKKTMKIVKQNIIFSIFVKIAVLILSALGLTTMWWAVFADVGVSVIAILNALRVLNIKKD